MVWNRKGYVVISRKDGRVLTTRNNSFPVYTTEEEARRFVRMVTATKAAGVAGKTLRRWADDGMKIISINISESHESDADEVQE